MKTETFGRQSWRVELEPKGSRAENLDLFLLLSRSSHTSSVEEATSQPARCSCEKKCPGGILSPSLSKMGVFTL